MYNIKYEKVEFIENRWDINRRCLIDNTKGCYVVWIENMDPVTGVLTLKEDGRLSQLFQEWFYLAMDILARDQIRSFPSTLTPEEKRSFIGFFELLLKVDKRVNPHLYVSKPITPPN